MGLDSMGFSIGDSPSGDSPSGDSSGILLECFRDSSVILP